MRPAPTGNNTDNVVIPKHLRDVTIVSKKAKQHAQFGHNIQVILFVDCILYYLHCCLLAFFILSIQQCAALHAFALNVFIIAVWFFLLKKKGYQLVGKAASILCIYIDVQCVSVVDFDWLFTVSMVFRCYKLIIGNSSLPVSAPSCSIFMWKNLMHFKMSSFG